MSASPTSAASLASVPSSARFNPARPRPWNASPDSLSQPKRDSAHCKDENGSKEIEQVGAPRPGLLLS